VAVRALATVLAAGLVPIGCANLAAYTARTKPNQLIRARQRARTFRSAVNMWMIEAASSDSCPSTTDLAAARILDSEGHYADPWGNNFVIQCPTDDVVVTSLGPDGQFGTDDDIRIPRHAD
jgi:hypothetical protein